MEKSSPHSVRWFKHLSAVCDLGLALFIGKVGMTVLFVRKNDMQVFERSKPTQMQVCFQWIWGSLHLALICHLQKPTVSYLGFF